MSRVAHTVRLLASALLLVAMGCDRDGSSATQGPLKQVRIGYFGNVTHAQAVLGVHSGEFKSAVAPAELKTSVFNAGPSLIEALFAGEIDIGYIGPGPAINGYARSRGDGLRVISGVSANGVLIVARKEAGIASMEGLKGRKLATPQLGNTQDISAKHYLKSQLKQDNLSNVVPVQNAEQSALMARGQVDAVWAVEPWASRLIVENGAVVVGREEEMWPDKQFTLALIITTPRFLKEHPEVVEKVLGVHRSWTKRLSEAPEKHLPQLEEALFAISNKRLPAGVLGMALKNVRFTDDPLDQTLATMAQWSYELQFLPQKPRLDGLVDLTILRKLQAAEKR